MLSVQKIFIYRMQDIYISYAGFHWTAVELRSNRVEALSVNELLLKCYHNCFSTQHLVNGGYAMELDIVVRGTSIVSLHNVCYGGGSTSTATVITLCNQDNSVPVKAVQLGTQRIGQYSSQFPSMFKLKLKLMLMSS